MNIRERRKLHRQFFEQLGPAGKTLKDMFYDLPNIAFNMKDLDCRIMAINRRNCEICNIKDEWDAIGFQSSDLFSKDYAESYMALDREAIRRGKPILGHRTQYPADRSLRVTVANIYPLRGLSGEFIGTARAYHLAPDCEDTTSRYGQIRAVALFVENHFAEEIRLSDLVAKTSMSLTTFKQVFMGTFNMTPGHYLTTIRLNAARKLLETTDNLLSDIAVSTGFFDQSHFTRIFKKERGVTPGEYRRLHRAIVPPMSEVTLFR